MKNHLKLENYIIYKGEHKNIEIANDILIFTDSRDYKKGLDYSCIWNYW